MGSEPYSQDMELRFHFLEHEVVIILNTVHLFLLIYYFIFEILGCMYGWCGYSSLPKLEYFTQSSSKLSRLMTPILKLISLVGAAFSLIGATNLHLVPLLFGLLTCSGFALHDSYLLLKGRYHYIDVRDFLLCQTLFTSTFRFVRLMSIVCNIELLYYFI